MKSPILRLRERRAERKQARWERRLARMSDTERDARAKIHCDGIARFRLHLRKMDGTLNDKLRVQIVDESVAETIETFKLNSNWRPY